MSIIDEIRGLLEHHAPEIDRMTQVTAEVDADPLTHAASAAASLTPVMRQALGDLIACLDGELARVVQEATDNGRAAGHATAVAELAPPAPEGEQPPG